MATDIWIAGILLQLICIVLQLGRIARAIERSHNIKGGA